MRDKETIGTDNENCMTRDGLTNNLNEIEYFILNNDMKGLFIFLCLFSFLHVYCKLYQVVAIISPGARYHLNDLYDGKDYQSKWGEITAVGLRQQQNLGKLLRKEYIESTPFLSSNFTKEEFQIFSLSLNRSIESSLANRYGLYPLGQGQLLINTDPKYHIPPYSYKDDATEQKYALPEGQLIRAVQFDSGLIESCPNEQVEIEKNIKLQASDYNEMVITYTPFLKKTATAFGMDPNSMNFTKFAALFDTITVDKYLGKSLPSGFSKEDYANGQHLYNWYTHFTRSFNLSKALNSHKIEKTLSLFDERVKKPTGVALKWTTISVDGLDIVALQNDLNISSALCIEQIYRKGSTQALNCQQGAPFASSIILELHSDNGKDFYVRVRDNGKYVNLCEARKRDCGYDEWRGRVQRVIVSNPQSICGKPKESMEAAMIVTE